MKAGEPCYRIVSGEIILRELFEQMLCFIVMAWQKSSKIDMYRRLVTHEILPPDVAEKVIWTCCVVDVLL